MAAPVEASTTPQGVTGGSLYNIRFVNDSFNTEAKTPLVSFSKPKKRPQVRQRTSQPIEREESEPSAVVKKSEGPVAGALVATTKGKKRTLDDLSYKSSGAERATPLDRIATATLETETDRSMDSIAIEERARKKREEAMASLEAGNTDVLNTYRGASGYLNYVEVKDTSGQMKGTGIRAGPVRASMYARAISRIDYQPDVCKDYKETGYCGFGDSCKFMHDRGDYKNSYELEKEWEEQQKLAKSGKMVEDVSANQLEDVPFSCAICRKFFVSPVETKCKHLFCEKCFLDHFRKSMKCATCGENTMGVFKPVSKQMREKIEERQKQVKESGEFNEDEQDDTNNTDDAQ